jgi:hypothetical protein
MYVDVLLTVSLLSLGPLRNRAGIRGKHCINGFTKHNALVRDEYPIGSVIHRTSSTPHELDTARARHCGFRTPTFQQLDG